MDASKFHFQDYFQVSDLLSQIQLAFFSQMHSLFYSYWTEMANNTYIEASHKTDPICLKKW